MPGWCIRPTLQATNTERWARSRIPVTETGLAGQTRWVGKEPAQTISLWSGRAIARIPVTNAWGGRSVVFPFTISHWAALLPTNTVTAPPESLRRSWYMDIVTARSTSPEIVNVFPNSSTVPGVVGVAFIMEIARRERCLRPTLNQAAAKFR